MTLTSDKVKEKFFDFIENHSFIKEISDLSYEMKTQVFLVGGFTRDLVLDREKKEFDLLVVGSGIEFAKELAKKLNVADVIVYKNFGVAHFKYKEWSFEFVGARKESYQRHSRKPIVENGTFDDDINRRDFTINAIAISLNKDNFGEVIDKFNGLEDIEKKIIKTPLEPEKTFSDDPLRMLRAIRFASVLGFSIEENTFEAIRKMRERIKIVSQERISDEFLKIMGSKKPSIGLKLLQDSGLNEIIFPELHMLSGVEQRNEYHHKDVFNHTLMVVDNVAEKSDNLWLRIAALLHDIAKPKVKKFDENVGWTFHGHEELGARQVNFIFKKMRWPLDKVNYVANLVKLHMRPIALVDEEVTDSAVRRLIAQAGSSLNDLILLCRADITSHNPNKVKKFLENYDKVVDKILKVEETDRLSSFKCPLDGKTIMQICKLKPSPKVGAIKKAVEAAIIDGKIANSKEAAINFLIENKDRILNSLDSKLKLLFASYNNHKYIEVKDILNILTKNNLEIFYLGNFDKKITIIEDGHTFEENALLKAKKAYEEFGIPSFADDSGLEVEALNGGPGVFSSRYAGDNANDEENLKKLLFDIADIPEPIKARFVSCIAFYDGNEVYTFWGELKGRLIKKIKGDNGFGYDPIFVPEGHNLTLAEMPLKIKNKISHRYKAVWNFANFLLTKYIGGENAKETI